jgi:hypothetical protein
MQFYLIRDRDYLSADRASAMSNHSSGRVHVLLRHEIENYLLDDDVIATVQTEIFGKPVTAADVRTRLRQAARRIAGEVLRDMLAFRLNIGYRPADFSMGNMFKGEAIINDDGSWMDDKISTLKSGLDQQAAEINALLQEGATPDAIDEIFKACQAEVAEAVTGETDGWRSSFPGKRLLEIYAVSEGLGKSPAFQNSLIKQFAASAEKIPPELQRLISCIENGQPFTTV